jgi:hypothetical protein
MVVQFIRNTISLFQSIKSAETNAAEALVRAEIVQSNVKQLTELDSLVYKNIIILSLRAI